MNGWNQQKVMELWIRFDFLLQFGYIFPKKKNGVPKPKHRTSQTTKPGYTVISKYNPNLKQPNIQLLQLGFVTSVATFSRQALPQVGRLLRSLAAPARGAQRGA